MEPEAFQLLCPVDTSLFPEPLLESFLPLDTLFSSLGCCSGASPDFLDFLDFLKALDYFLFFKLFCMSLLTLQASSSTVSTHFSNAIGFGKMWGVGDVHSQWSQNGVG